MDALEQDGQFVVVLCKYLHIFLVLDIVLVVVRIQKGREVVVEHHRVLVVPMVVPILAEDQVVIVVNGLGCNGTSIGHERAVIEFKEELFVLDHVQEGIDMAGNLVQLEEERGFFRGIVQDGAPIRE